MSTYMLTNSLDDDWDENEIQYKHRHYSSKGLPCAQPEFNRRRAGIPVVMWEWSDHTSKIVDRANV